jgi:hypothetical protein
MFTKLLLVAFALLSPIDPTAALAVLGEHLAAPTPASEPVASIQIELLPDYDSAERLAAEVAERITAAGLTHEVLVEIVPGEPELPVSYRVVVGPFHEFEDAERARTEIENIGVNGFVREYEPLVGC